MLTPDFAFCQTCGIKRFLRRGLKADEFADPVTAKCRVNFKAERVSVTRGGDVREVNASGSVWFAAGTEVKPQDVIVFGGADHTVLSVLPSYDIYGRLNHVEVMIE